MSRISLFDCDDALLQVMRLSAMLDSESAHETPADALLSRALFIALDIDACAVSERGA